MLHAQWREHAYPAHTHDTWTLLVVDDGVIGYELEGQDHGANARGVTLLPPHLAHDGHSTSSSGFRKRVVYLDVDVLDESLVGAAVDAPLVKDEALRERVSLLDRALIRSEFGEVAEAEAQLALVIERLEWHLTGRRPAGLLPPTSWAAQRARNIFDADPLATPSLTAVAAVIGVSVAHLVRSFTRSYGLPPHRYLIGRRLDVARRRLLDGEDAARVATETGFYDQAHLTRHFKKLLATTPGSYQRSGHRAQPRAPRISRRND